MTNRRNLHGRLEIERREQREKERVKGKRDCKSEIESRDYNIDEDLSPFMVDLLNEKVVFPFSFFSKIKVGFSRTFDPKENGLFCSTVRIQMPLGSLLEGNGYVDYVMLLAVGWLGEGGRGSLLSFWICQT